MLTGALLSILLDDGRRVSPKPRTNVARSVSQKTYKSCIGGMKNGRWRSSPIFTRTTSDRLPTAEIIRKIDEDTIENG